MPMWLNDDEIERFDAARKREREQREDWAAVDRAERETHGSAALDRMYERAGRERKA